MLNLKRIVRENEQFSHKIEDGRDDILERKTKIDMGEEVNTWF